MNRAYREWAIIMLGWFSSVLVAIGCFWFSAFLESKHYESQPLEEVELIVRPSKLTANWYFCGHEKNLNTVGRYLNCINELQARIDF